MRNVKKLVSIILTFTLLCTMLVIPAAAASTTVTLGFDATSGWDGSTYTAKITAVSSDGQSFDLNSAQMQIGFDNKVLNLSEERIVSGIDNLAVTATNASTANVNGAVTLTWLDLGGENHTISSGQVLATLKFSKVTDETCDTELAFTGPAIDTYISFDIDSIHTIVSSAKQSIHVTGAPATLKEVTLNPTSVVVNGTTGGTVQATATSTKNDNNDITSSVTWSVAPTDKGVTIGETTGTITADPKAEAGTYTITASPKDGESQGTAQTATLTVTRAPAVATTVEIAGETTLLIPKEGQKDNEYTYTATVKDQYGDEISNPTVTWAMEPETVTGVTMNNGTITVTSEATDQGTATLTAKVGELSKSVTLTLSAVNIVPNWPESIVTGNTFVYGKTNQEATSFPATGTATVGETTTTVDGTFSLKAPNEKLSAGPQKIVLQFTVTTDGDYKGVVLEKEYDVTVTKQTLTGNVKISVPDGTETLTTGTVLTADVTALPTDAAVTYQWFRGEIAIPDATTATYTIADADEDAKITVKVTAGADSNYTGTITSPVVTVGKKATAPKAPTDVTASASGMTITVNWKAPTDDDADAITGYKVTLGSETKPVGANETSCTFDVSYGTYTATVVAVNAWGDSEPSTRSNPVTISRPVDNNNSNNNNSGSSSSGTSGSSSPAPKPLPDRNQGTTTPANPTTPTNPDDNNPTDSTSFNDVPANHWAAGAIDWVNTQGLMNGISGTQFAPDNQTTRQQLWMILARLNGTSPANMVEARTWAMNNGISDGTNADQNMSRQQMVTFLYRYAQQKGYQLTGSADLSSYSDNSAVSGYAREALAWAVANGIVNGTSQTTLSPLGTATRAQFATILQRFYNSVVNK